MKRMVCSLVFVFILLQAGFAGAQSKSHASVGLGHGEEGYLHLEEMIRHLELAVRMPDATPDFKKHAQAAIQIGREAMMAYDEALRHASQALGRPAGKGPMPEGSEDEDEHEGSGMSN